MYQYIEIIKTESGEVVKRLDVTDRADRTIEKIRMGMSINLNHKEYRIDMNYSNTELPKI